MGRTLSIGKNISFNIGFLILGLLFINFGLLPIISERPDFPSVQCTNPTGTNSCGSEYDTAIATYNNAVALHESTIFWTSIIIGVILMAAGLYLTLNTISWGMILTGAIQFAIGSSQYWEHLNKYFRLGILGTGLGFLILMGYYYNKKRR